MAKSEARLPQPMRPSGRIGRIFGWLMARLNKPAYRWTVEQLRTTQPKSILEMGFGTGHLLALALRQLKPGRVAGRDPSDLMVETAQKRTETFPQESRTRHRSGRRHQPARRAIRRDRGAACFSVLGRSRHDTAEAAVPARTQGRLILVLRRHTSRKAAKRLPNPLSHGADEISATVAAAEAAGFALVGMSGISKGSHGLVFACG